MTNLSGKQRDNPFDKTKHSLLQNFARAMIIYGSILPQDSGYGGNIFRFIVSTLLTRLAAALAKFGEAHEQIAQAEIDFVRSRIEPYPPAH